MNTLLKRVPHLQYLNLHGCGGVSGEDLDPSTLSELRTLKLSGRQFRIDALNRLLKSLANLESLALYGIQSLDESRVTLSHLTTLKTLHVGTTAVRDNVLATLPDSLESLHVHELTVTKSSVITMLQRLTRLHTLKLYEIGAGNGSADDAQAVTGEGWDFRRQKSLRHLNLRRCRFLKDGLIATIATQTPSLESLELGEHRVLTGEGWHLNRLPKLKRLQIDNIPNLQDATVLQLPRSLELLKIEKCPKLTGMKWELSRLSRLNELHIRHCDLSTVGGQLPSSLRNLNIHCCSAYSGRRLDYSSMSQLERLSLFECFEFDVNRLFARLPKHARSLRTLNLTGCPVLSQKNWDMSPLDSSLVDFYYGEAEPSYVGGISEANAEQLTRQLPHCRVKSL